MFCVVIYTTSYLLRKIALYFLKPELQELYKKIHSSPATAKGEDIFRVALQTELVEYTIIPPLIISLTIFILLLAIKAWRSTIKVYVIANIILLLLWLIF